MRLVRLDPMSVAQPQALRSRIPKRTMTGLFVILLCWALGNGLSLLAGGYVSGNIIGMVLLFAALCMKWVRAETVRPAARFLLGAMALFFVPYGVGLMDSYRVLLDNVWTIVISGALSTVVVLLVAGKTYQRLNRKTRSDKNNDLP